MFTVVDLNRLRNYQTLRRPTYSSLLAKFPGVLYIQIKLFTAQLRVTASSVIGLQA